MLSMVVAAGGMSTAPLSSSPPTGELELASDAPLLSLSDLRVKKIEDYREHNDAMIMNPQFDDASLSEWLADPSIPSPSLETNILLHPMDDYLAHEDVIMNHDAELSEWLTDPSIPSPSLVWNRIYRAYIAGPSSPSHLVDTNMLDQMEHKLDSGIGHGTIAAGQISSDREIRIQEYCPGKNARIVETSAGKLEMRQKKMSDEMHIFEGRNQPFVSSAKTFCKRKRTRKNNPHWTEDEVKMLVDGVSRFGVGNWTVIRESYFKGSIRIPENLKAAPIHSQDKWTGLVRACGEKVGSKKEVKAHKATLEIIERAGLKDKILSISRKHVAQRRRASR
ncbi:hypothetical protein ACP70R_019179 [Stipagrostis hirtigluma subsp. patula]